MRIASASPRCVGLSTAFPEWRERLWIARVRRAANRQIESGPAFQTQVAARQAER